MFSKAMKMSTNQSRTRDITANIRKFRKMPLLKAKNKYSP